MFQFVFERKGIFIIENNGFDEDELTMDLIDGGAEDVEFGEELITVTSAMEDFEIFKRSLTELTIEPKEAGFKEFRII